MTTHEFEFDEIAEAFGIMDEKEDDIIKPLINFE